MIFGLNGTWADLGVAYVVALIIIAGIITLNKYLDRKK